MHFLAPLGYIYIYASNNKILASFFKLCIGFYIKVNLENIQVHNLPKTHMDSATHAHFESKFVILQPGGSHFRYSVCVWNLWYYIFLCLNSELKIKNGSALIARTKTQKLNCFNLPFYVTNWEIQFCLKFLDCRHIWKLLGVLGVEFLGHVVALFHLIRNCQRDFSSHSVLLNSHQQYNSIAVPISAGISVNSEINLGRTDILMILRLSFHKNCISLHLLSPLIYFGIVL